MKHILCLVLLALAGANAGFSQSIEVAATGSYPLIFDTRLGSFSQETPQDDDTRLQGKRGFGGRFTINSKGYYGHEFTYMNTKADMDATTRRVENKQTITENFRSPVNIQLGAYNFMMYMMPRGERFRPFITGGGQIYKYSNPGFVTDGSSYRTYGGNYGGGIKIKLAQHLLVRGDFRHYLGGKPYDLDFSDPAQSGGIHHMLEFSFGVALTF
ncbi:MAG: outer membrane beta-barrel protein [Acidobacteriia bacterium]|nr:outer membrane beta-barrel protein [Terriglobia bacterium]